MSAVEEETCVEQDAVYLDIKTPRGEVIVGESKWRLAHNKNGPEEDGEGKMGPKE